MDKGKSTMTGVEEYNDSSVKRHKSQTTPQERASDPSYKGRAPNSLLFYNKDGSPALLPYPVAMRPHICKAEFCYYIDHCVYHMRRICYTNIDRSFGKFLCTHCTFNETPCEMCSVRIHIADLSRPLTVNIFPQDIAYLLEMNYLSFFDYLNKGIDVRQLFEHLEGQNMLLHVQPMKTKEGTSWVAQQVLKIPAEEFEKEVFKTKTDIVVSSQSDLDDGMNNLFPEIAQGDYPVYQRFGEEDFESILYEDPKQLMEMFWDLRLFGSFKFIFTNVNFYNVI